MKKLYVYLSMLLVFVFLGAWKIAVGAYIVEPRSDDIYTMKSASVGIRTMEKNVEMDILEKKIEELDLMLLSKEKMLDKLDKQIEKKRKQAESIGAVNMGIYGTVAQQNYNEYYK